jgi:hypothetical protein
MEQCSKRCHGEATGSWRERPDSRLAVGRSAGSLDGPSNQAPLQAGWGVDLRRASPLLRAWYPSKQGRQGETDPSRCQEVRWRVRRPHAGPLTRLSGDAVTGGVPLDTWVEIEGAPEQ